MYNNIPIINDTSFIEIFENRNGCDSIITTQIMVQTSAIEEVLETNTMTLYPNPAANELNIDFDVKLNTNLGFQIINSLGEVVLNNENRKYFQQGKHTMNFKLNALPNGVYFLRLVAEKDVIEQPFIKH